MGGGIPIVFAYYCEFVSKSDRGRHLSWLLVFWAIGGVFTALMAWAIIPRTGEFYQLGKALWGPRLGSRRRSIDWGKLEKGQPKVRKEEIK